MNALLELVHDGLVALAARLWNIEMKNLRGRIVRRQDFMIAMATAARRGAINSRHRQAAVYAAAVGFERIFDGDVIFLHEGGVGMAARASESELARIHPRKGISTRADFVAAVTIAAGRSIRRRCAGGLALAVYACRNFFHSIFVTSRTSRRRQILRMGDFRDIGVAGDAFKSGMDRVVYFCRIDKQRALDSAAVRDHERRVAVAGKTITVADLRPARGGR